MKNRTKRILLIILTICVYAFIGYMLYKVKHIIQQDMPTMAITAGMLLGAFVAFLGIVITNGMYKLWKIFTL